MKDDLIYVLGGGKASVAFNMIFLPVFDVKERKWFSLPTKASEPGKYPADRKCHGIAVLEDGTLEIRILCCIVEVYIIDFDLL